RAPTRRPWRSRPAFCRGDRAGMPDVAAVIPDRSIRRELPDAGAVENRHAGPVRAIAIGLAEALLEFQIALEVGKEHVVVAREQRFDQRPKQLAVTLREVAGTDQIERLAQLG